MVLKEKWDADLKAAMLAKKDVVRDTLRLLLADIKKANVQEGKEITPAEIEWLRSHRAAVLLSLFTEIELGIHRRDGALLVMPMCHANSLNFFGAFTYCGAETAVYSR